ncbi:MAG: sigma-54-dependent Fis family transcriptional regulator, partial [Magnetospirillum sp.]|nr:sigma-54-dependent Fis family transcriptional regulator [Magnetospirillum sp.]
MYCQTIDEAGLTKEVLAGLGADALAQIVLEQAAKDPTLVERLRPALAPAATAAAEPPMVGTSPAMQRLAETIRKVAATDAPVLVAGESGTGKELAAIAIHQRSIRALGPFVPINCAALPKTLIASELFVHEKGGFTCADQRLIGRLHAADTGTVFLDEIGDLPLDLQAHLLRFLQESTIDRLGGHQPIKVDVRVIAATNVPLRKAVADGRFREDLFFRLNVLTLTLPPLRERGEDIDLLAAHFTAKFAREAARPIRGLSPEAVGAIRRHPWPGNIRELIATMRRAVVMADGPWIQVADLGLPDGDDEDGPAPATSLEAARRDLEEAMIRRSLAANRHNVKRTAETLGVSRVTLYRLMDKYGIVSG